MNQLEQNISNSFRLAKSDMIQLQNKVIEMNQTQQRIIEFLDILRNQELKLYQRMKSVENAKALPRLSNCKRQKTEFVAPKAGDKFHKKNCPFAKNIKPKNKVVFHSKTKALNQGFKPCKCVQ